MSTKKDINVTLHLDPENGHTLTIGRLIVGGADIDSAVERLITALEFPTLGTSAESEMPVRAEHKVVQPTTERPEEQTDKHKCTCKENKNSTTDATEPKAEHKCSCGGNCTCNKDKGLSAGADKTEVKRQEPNNNVHISDSTVEAPFEFIGGKYIHLKNRSMPRSKELFLTAIEAILTKCYGKIVQHLYVLNYAEDSQLMVVDVTTPDYKHFLAAAKLVLPSARELPAYIMVYDTHGATQPFAKKMVEEAFNEFVFRKLGETLMPKIDLDFSKDTSIWVSTAEFSGNERKLTGFSPVCLPDELWGRTKVICTIPENFDAQVVEGLIYEFFQNFSGHLEVTAHRQKTDKTARPKNDKNNKENNEPADKGNLCAVTCGDMHNFTIKHDKLYLNDTCRLFDPELLRSGALWLLEKIYRKSVIEVGPMEVVGNSLSFVAVNQDKVHFAVRVEYSNTLSPTGRLIEVFDTYGAAQDRVKKVICVGIKKHLSSNYRRDFTGVVPKINKESVIWINTSMARTDSRVIAELNSKGMGLPEALLSNVVIDLFAPFPIDKKVVREYFKNVNGNIYLNVNPYLPKKQVNLTGNKLVITGDMSDTPDEALDFICNHFSRMGIQVEIHEIDSRKGNK